MQNLLKSRRSPALIAGFVSAMLWSYPVDASVVTYEITNMNGSPTSTNVIENSGTYLGAVDVAAGSLGSVKTINGVTFNPGAHLSNPRSTTNSFSSGLSISYSLDVSDSGTISKSLNIDERYEASNFEPVMQTVLFSGGNGSVPLSLDGLVSGRDYRVQFLMDDLGRGGVLAKDLAMSISATGGDTGDSDLFTYGVSGGKSVLANFTTGTGQTSITFDLIAGDGSRSVLSGISVFDVTAVPEPGTLSMLLLGLLSILGIRRSLQQRAC